MPFYWYKGFPDSSIDLETLEELILQRYNAYSAPETSCKYEFENINSVDSVGHLFMCIIANESMELREMIIRGELKLFSSRLNSRSVSEIKNNLLLFSTALNENKNNFGLEKKSLNRLSIFEKAIEAVTNRVDHVFDNGHKLNCRKSSILLPFHVPVSLVSKREVEVKNGKAKVYCGKWKMFLEDIFRYLIEIELTAIGCHVRKLFDEMEDDRIRQIITRASNRLNGIPYISGKVISIDNIDEESQLFPPCMAALHQNLRQNHRLSYDSRYQYTLFLKDAGLKVEDSLRFWEEEYSKPRGVSSCCHDWEEKKNRYTYQIRHLYGLIGSCPNKTSHSCDKFTQNLTLKMNGGCPFVQLSENELVKALPLNQQFSDDIEDILSFKKSKEPQKACAVYLRCQEKYLLQKKNLPILNRIRNLREINSPIQYYYLAKNLLEQVNACDNWL